MKSAEPGQSTVTAPPHADSQAPEQPADLARALDQPADRARTEDELIEAELLVEDVSIDGMCGVY